MRIWIGLDICLNIVPDMEEVQLRSLKGIRAIQQIQFQQREMKMDTECILVESKEANGSVTMKLDEAENSAFYSMW